MWYRELIDHLAVTICTDNPENAKRFSRDLFAAMKSIIYKKDDPEPLMLFGFIIDLYKFREQSQGRTLSLSEFAKECLALAVVHAKHTDDNGLTCSDFNKILVYKRIYEPLGIINEIEVVKDEFFDGTRHHSLITPSKEVKKYAQHKSNADNWLLVSLTEIIKRIERQHLEKRNYSVEVNINEFIRVFNLLLTETGNQVKLGSNFVAFLYANEVNMDALLLSVDEYIKQFYAQPDSFETESLYKEADQFCFSCLEIKLSDLQIKLNDLKDPVRNARTIRPLLSPDLFLICHQLERYIKTTGLYSFFTTKGISIHGSQVSEIVELIRTGQLQTVESVVNELKAIKPFHFDNLAAIIDELEQKYECFSNTPAPELFSEVIEEDSSDTSIYYETFL